MTSRIPEMTRGMPRYRVRATTRALVLLGVIAVNTSCNHDTVVSVNPVASIDLTPPAASVRAGSSVTLAARPKDGAGNAVDVRTFVWSSSNKVVATVSNSGVVTALATGEARIAASALGKSATAVITVTARDVATVIVSPATVSMRVGASTPLQAQTLDAEGGTLTGRVITWGSSNTAVATVSSSGSVTGVAPGATTITASSEGRVGQAAVTVTLAPVQTITVAPSVDTLGVGTERLHSAVLRDAGGAILTGRALSWSSSNVSIASVSSIGNVIGVAPGTTTISANSEGRTGTATIVVLARLAGVVTLTPNSNTLVEGATLLLVTQITDDQGNLLTGRPVLYSSDAPTIASVSATGLITAVASGTARITATSEGKSGAATVVVVPIPVSTVVITPGSATMITATAQALAATARSASGATITGRAVQWTSGAPNIASVSANGLVTALTPGVALIVAAIDGVTATSRITVVLPTIASIALTPDAPSIASGTSVQLSATPRDASGASLTGRTITWTSDDESIAFVSSTGLVVGFKVGTIRITATSEGVSASTFVTVR